MSCEVSDKSKNDSSKADHLNTRIPYGIRPVVKVRSYTIIVFQSTHPVWDATREVRAGQVVGAGFQSTHPVWDATLALCLRYPLLQNFNPRIPYGMRLFVSHSHAVCGIFQSTHPVWDATCHDVNIHPPFVFCFNFS